MKTHYLPLLLGLLSFNAFAGSSSTLDAAIGGAIGGGLGAAVGNEVAGRDGAIIGGAIGAGVGAAVSTADDDKDRYRRDYHRHDGRVYMGGAPRRHCPPGLAMQGRC